MDCRRIVLHKTILRQLIAILGAIGLVVFFQGLFDLNGTILAAVHEFQSATHPIWETVLGWLFRWIDWPFPGWFKNYLTMGTIVTGSFIYTAVSDDAWSDLEERWSACTFVFACWPIMVGGAAILSVKDRWNAEITDSRQVNLEFVLWAFAIIAVNYGLLWTMT